MEMETLDTNNENIILNNRIAVNEEEKVNMDMNETTQDQSMEYEISIKTERKETFQCKICPYNTLRKPYLDKHMQQKHGFTKVKVEKKGNLEIKLITKSDNRRMRFEDHDQIDEEFGCNLCSFKTRHLNLLNIHQEIHQSKHKGIVQELYQCTDCDFKTEQVAALRAHERTHRRIHLFNCPNCDYASRIKSNLTAHMKVHKDLERFHCPICNVIFLHYNALARHIRKQHGVTGEIQVTSDKNKIHEGFETGPMFQCEKCIFVTHNEQTMQKHVQKHEEREKNGEEIIVKEKLDDMEIIWFCCDRCDFRSREQRYVMLHKKVHKRVDEINKVGEDLVQSVKENRDSVEDS